ncbi:unnamed protein product [Ectocarpus sp. 12 AP-2014]
MCCIHAESRENNHLHLLSFCQMPVKPPNKWRARTYLFGHLLNETGRGHRAFHIVHELKTFQKRATTLGKRADKRNARGEDRGVKRTSNPSQPTSPSADRTGAVH